MDAATSTGEKHVGADVTADFKTRIRMHAASRDMAMSEYIRLALSNQMERDDI